MLDRILNYIAPRRCLGCDAVSERAFCGDCGDPTLTPSGLGDIDGIEVVAAGTYSGALAEAVKRFKYSGRPDMARPLARLLVPWVVELGVEAPTWVPVPLHPARLAERGYNQSALLAQYLARFCGGTVQSRSLMRTERTQKQAALAKKSDRERNVREAFQVRGKAPSRVVLVDDVVTTGATVRGCVGAFAEREVRVLGVVALARAAVAAGGRLAEEQP